MNRNPKLLAAIVLIGIVAAARTASAQRSAEEQVARDACRPPLKFMAGACVPQCYAGYEDRGRWCEYRRSGGLGGGGP